jgi:CBS domain containing-hemolysin-like protein
MGLRLVGGVGAILRPGIGGMHSYVRATTVDVEDPLTAIGLPVSAVPVIGALVGVLFATLFSRVLGELVPKNFALAVPLATAEVLVGEVEDVA